VFCWFCISHGSGLISAHDRNHERLLYLVCGMTKQTGLIFVAALKYVCIRMEIQHECCNISIECVTSCEICHAVIYIKDCRCITDVTDGKDISLLCSTFFPIRSEY